MIINVTEGRPVGALAFRVRNIRCLAGAAEKSYIRHLPNRQYALHIRKEALCLWRVLDLTAAVKSATHFVRHPLGRLITPKLVGIEYRSDMQRSVRHIVRPFIKEFKSRSVKAATGRANPTGNTDSVGARPPVFDKNMLVDAEGRILPSFIDVGAAPYSPAGDADERVRRSRGRPKAERSTSPKREKKARELTRPVERASEAQAAASPPADTMTVTTSRPSRWLRSDGY